LGIGRGRQKGISNAPPEEPKYKKKNHRGADRASNLEDFGKTRKSAKVRIGAQKKAPPEEERDGVTDIVAYI